MIHRFNQQTFTEKLTALIETEEVKYALMAGELKVRCDHAKKRFWFVKCPEHLWDVAESSVVEALGYKPIDDFSIED